MSRKRFLKTVAPALVVASLSAPSAQGAVILDNWIIDFEAVGNQAGGDFTGFGVLAAGGIDTITFNGIFHAVTDPVTGRQTTSLLGVATSFLNDSGIIGATTGGALVNTVVGNIPAFELTLAGTTTQQITGVAGGVTSFVHLAAGAPNVAGSIQVSGAPGQLDIYIDNLQDAIGVKANTSPGTGGAGMTDGVLLASFNVLPGSGGTFTEATRNGSDDAQFELISNPFGAVKDQFGNALLAGSVIALTDSNTDADPDGNGVRDTQFAAGPLSGAATGCNVTPQLSINACGTEDGSFVLANVPEPSTVALLGLTLAGLGGRLGFRRRSTKS